MQRRGNPSRPASITRMARCAAAGLMLTQLLAVASAVEPLARPTGAAACAAFDLHVVLEIEAAGTWQTMHPADLLTAVENVMAARRACTDGHFVQAARIYEGLDLGPSNAPVWR